MSTSENQGPDDETTRQEVFLTPDDRIIQQAKDRAKLTLEWETYCRKNFIEDMKFGKADNVNGYQWPEKIRMERDRDAKPWLTINKTRQHCIIIKNDAKKNKPAMVAKPTSGEATYRSALAYNALFRAIEAASRAQEVYSIAMDYAIDGGWGYWRVMSEYRSHDTDEQEIRIRPINDPLSVLFDPNIKQPDGSDADWCLIFSEMPRKEFLHLYPEYRTRPVPKEPLGVMNSSSWFGKDKVRMAEYMRKKKTKSKLYTFSQGDKKVSMLENEIPKDLLQAFTDGMDHSVRHTELEEIEWFLIFGDVIHQRTTYKGRYIPVVRIVPEEWVLDGRLDRPGHIRALRDPQRMYNYWATAATEFAGLQTKSPWLAAQESIEGQIDIWNRSNIENPAVLAYRSIGEDGQPLPVPQKIPPPQGAPAYLQGMQQAMQDMTMVSGQYSAMMGEPSNERSGKAIGARQRQGDTATYHYVDAMARSIRHTAVIIMDMIPQVYDTKRVLYALNPDGSKMSLTIDPQAKEHFQEDQDAAEAILNPRGGSYDIVAEIGPDWGTKREETFEALTVLMAQNPQLSAAVGDLLMKSADFDLADEAAERLRRAVPPHLLGEGPTPQEQALTAQLAELTKAMKNIQEFSTKTVEDNAKLRMELKNKDSLRDIDVYDSETKRAAAFAKLITPEMISPVLRQMIGEMLATHLQSEVDVQDGLPTQSSEQPPGSSAGSPVQSAGLLPPAPDGDSQGDGG